MLRPTQAEISLDNLRHNIDVLRRGLNKNTRYLAVVKANAYGHGITEVAKCALSHGADYLAVAIAEEGMGLRNSGVNAPILILGASPESSLDCIVEYGLIPAVFDAETVLQLEERARRMKRGVDVHVKIDTGMNRIGVTSMAQFTSLMNAFDRCERVRFSGMFTHFAVSERTDKSFTLLQGERFRAYADAAHERGYAPLLHACNSAAALEMPSLQFDMVRGGIAMYGCHPSGHSVPGVDLKPVLSWKTNVAFVKDVPAGEGISYGLRFVTRRPSRIATLPLGYGDGYKRSLTNQAQVLIHGVRVPQVGTICMDQLMCDVTDVPGVACGDEAVLIGRQGEEEITADEMAGWAGTISYEILLSISDRVPRIYV